LQWWHVCSLGQQRRRGGLDEVLRLPTLGQHGLDVAAPVLAEDDRLGAAGAALRPLLLLREHEDRGVQHHALAVKDELLGHLVRLLVVLLLLYDTRCTSEDSLN